MEAGAEGLRVGRPRSFASSPVRPTGCLGPPDLHDVLVTYRLEKESEQLLGASLPLVAAPVYLRQHRRDRETRGRYGWPLGRPEPAPALIARWVRKIPPTPARRRRPTVDATP
jgi:hypothetical protein